MPRKNPSVVNVQDPKTWPSVEKTSTMWGTTREMKKILEKYPALGDEWVEKQLNSMARGKLYFTGVADAIRKGQVSMEQTYFEHPGFHEYAKGNPELEKLEAQRTGGEYNEQITRKRPEQELNLKQINELLNPKYKEMIPQIGTPLPGQEDLNDILSGLAQQYKQRFGPEHQKAYDIYNNWNDFEGGHSFNDLLGGIRSGGEGLYNMGRSGMQGLQNLYNDWNQPYQTPGQQQVPSQQMYPQQQVNSPQQMEQVLALLNSERQHDPRTGVGGRIKERRPSTERVY